MNRESLTDQELVNLTIKNRDQKAFGILYDRYHLKIYSKCISFTKSQEEAEDLCHDIFIKILLKLSTYKSESTFYTWIYAITYNSCVDYAKKKSKIRNIDFDSDEIDSERLKVFHSDSEKNLMSIQAEELQEVLEQLKPEDKMILLLKYQDDLSIEKLQEVFKIGKSAVKMRLLRARERALKIHKLQNNKSS